MRKTVTFALAEGFEQGNETRFIPMKMLLSLLLWAILLALCWPLALLILALWPILWLLSIPFRIVGAVLEGIVALVSALLFLPARILGYRPR